jgi:predicted dehydrogenase
MNRRVFVAATALSQTRVVGANDRIRIAGIGVGGRSRLLLRYAKEQPGTEIVAFCDVYEPRRLEAREQIAASADLSDDYRRLLDRKDIDAVIVGSPDHWHVPMTVDAVRAGKDVYVEKPLSHTIEEAARCVKAVAETKQIVQVGYQQRSWPHFIAAREIVASGKLGAVPLVQTSWYQNYLRFDAAKAAIDESKIDWKAWLGKAPKQPVSAIRYLRWRWFWDFGGGHLTDLHSHYGDVVHWYTGQYEPLDAVASGGVHAVKFMECPDTISCTWSYPGFSLNYTGALVGSLGGGNILFRGSQALLQINRDGYAVYPEGKVPPERTHLPEADLAMKSTRDGTIDHMANWLECVRSRKEPSAPVRLCAAAAKAAHLGNAAYRRGARTTFQDAS